MTEDTYIADEERGPELEAYWQFDTDERTLHIHISHVSEAHVSRTTARLTEEEAEELAKFIIDLK